MSIHSKFYRNFVLIIESNFIFETNSTFVECVYSFSLKRSRKTNLDFVKTNENKKKKVCNEI